MNVITVCLSLDLGGLELYALRSACMLAKNHNVTAVVSEGTRLAEKFEDSAIETINLQSRFKPLPVPGARKLARLIDSLEIHAVHMHWGKDLPLVSFARKYSRRKPVIVYTRQMQITRHKKDFYHQMQYREVDLILCITRALAEDYRRFLEPEHRSKVHTLYYGVAAPDHLLSDVERDSARRELGLEHNDFLVGSIGRLEKQKGQHLLIEAISEARRGGCPVQALIVGHEMSAGYRDELKSLARSLGLEHQVMFKDFVSNPQQLMQVCDCVALTTYEETFGLVLPEAMRAGVCVIGSNRGGVPEIIDDNETGLLFDSEDAKDLARQIVRLCNDINLVKKLAAQGKRKADRLFNTETHEMQLGRFFQDAVG